MVGDTLVGFGIIADGLLVIVGVGFLLGNWLGVILIGAVVEVKLGYPLGTQLGRITVGPELGELIVEGSAVGIFLGL